MIGFQAADIFLVTGASSGLGEGLALKLNELGATVIASGRDQDRLAALRAKSARPESIHPEPKDLAADIDGLPGWVKSLRDKYGRLRGLAHCAGLSDLKPLQMIEYESFRQLFDLNFFAAVLLAKGFFDRRVNTGRGAALVMMSSVAAQWPDRGQLIYGASKAALASAVTAMAKEVAPQGLRANCIAPALVPGTSMSEGQEDTFGRALGHDDYLLGLGEVNDVVALAVFLLSDAARWITGREYVLDGGRHL